MKNFRGGVICVKKEKLKNKFYIKRGGTHL